MTAIIVFLSYAFIFFSCQLFQLIFRFSHVVRSFFSPRSHKSEAAFFVAFAFSFLLLLFP